MSVGITLGDVLPFLKLGENDLGSNTCIVDLTIEVASNCLEDNFA